MEEPRAQENKAEQRDTLLNNVEPESEPTTTTTTTTTSAPAQSTALQVIPQPELLPVLPARSEEQIKAYAWQSNGSKKTLKSGVLRQHFRCSNYADEKGSCPGRMFVDTLADGSTATSLSHEHNHSPPTHKYKRSKKEKDPTHTTSFLAIGPPSTPTHPSLAITHLAHSPTHPSLSITHLTAQSPTHSPAHTPTHAPAHGATSKYAIDLTKSFTDNIIALNHAHPHLIGWQLVPQYTLTIVPPEALDLLANQNVKVAYLDASLTATKDGTFQLVTLMIDVGGIFTPVAWFITDTRQDSSYASFFRILMHCSNDKFHPKFIFCNYEDGLRAACRSVFPNARILGNGFHFVQEHVKFLRNNRKSEHIQELVPELKDLWLSASPEIYHKKMESFCTKWREQLPEYVAYVRTTWCERYVPATWAYYGQPNMIALGDRFFEEWHRRMNLKEWGATRERVDMAVKNVLEEWDNFYYSLKNPTQIP